MVETRPTAPRTGGLITEGDRRAGPPILSPPSRSGGSGRPGQRWPSPRELAALVVDGILRLPARYRRGMFLDILV